MTVLVDAAAWEWRGAKWAHLVSDESYDELHDFARRIGKRRLGFQGDHYDIEAVDRERAIDLGAEVVDARVLVRRLRAAGLRRRDHKPTWQRVAHAAIGEQLSGAGLPGRLGDVIGAVADVDRRSRSSVYVDDAHVVALFDFSADLIVPAEMNVDLVWHGEPRADGERSLELFLARG